MKFSRGLPTSVRALVAVNALAIALPVFALLWLSFEQTKDRVETGLTLIADGSVARGDSILQNTQHVLQSLVAANRTGCSDEDRKIYSEIVYEHIEIRGIGVLDRNTKTFECSDARAYSPPLKVERLDDLVVGKPGEIAIVPPREDLLKQVSIFINYGHGDGRILDAAIYPQQFWDFQDALGLGDGGAVMLLDAQGNELTTLRESKSNIKATPAQSNAKGLLIGEEMFSVTSRSSKYPIAAVAMISVDTVMASWRRTLLTFAPLALALAGFASWGIWRNAIRTRPLSEELREALANDALHLVYQPIVDVNTGRTKTVEVLCRWKHKTKGDISPELFIPEASRAGLLPTLSAWVFTQTAAELQPLFSRKPNFRVSLNVGREDLVADGPLSLAMQRLPEVQKHFTVEITERDSLAEMLDTARDVLNGWRSAGVRVALDDFGTGCCNLSYLRELPIDVVKIDRMFSAPLDDASGSKDAEMFDAMLSLLLYRKLEIVVEGIERESQHLALRSRHVNLAQGWYYARPMSVSALETWLAAPERDAFKTA